MNRKSHKKKSLFQVEANPVDAKQIILNEVNVTVLAIVMVRMIIRKAVALRITRKDAEVDQKIDDVEVVQKNEDAEVAQKNDVALRIDRRKEGMSLFM